MNWTRKPQLCSLEYAQAAWQLSQQASDCAQNDQSHIHIGPPVARMQHDSGRCTLLEEIECQAPRSSPSSPSSTTYRQPQLHAREVLVKQPVAPRQHWVGMSAVLHNIAAILQPAHATLSLDRRCGARTVPRRGDVPHAGPGVLEGAPLLQQQLLGVQHIQPDVRHSMPVSCA